MLLQKEFGAGEWGLEVGRKTLEWWFAVGKLGRGWEGNKMLFLGHLCLMSKEDSAAFKQV